MSCIVPDITHASGYNAGETIPIDADFGEDPDAVSFGVRKLGGSETLYLYGTAAEVERLSLGVYRLYYEAATRGTYYVRVIAADAQGREEISRYTFQVC